MHHSGVAAPWSTSEVSAPSSLGLAHLNEVSALTSRLMSKLLQVRDIMQCDLEKNDISSFILQT